jgi:protoheme IX farnesyltransferase
MNPFLKIKRIRYWNISKKEVLIILFSILVLWQMPHSFAIAIYRLGDYSSAHIPVLPVVRGIRATKIQIAVYTVLFVIATLMLFVFGYSGKLYVILMSIVGVVWIWIAGKGLTTRSTDDRTWAKKLFMFSIITLLVWCLVIMVEHYIA